MDHYFWSPESSRDRPLEIKHTAYPLLTWTLSVTAYDNIRNWQALTSAADAPASVTCKRSTCWNLIQSQVCWVKAFSSSKQPQENDSGKDWHVPVKGSFVSNVGNYGKSYPKKAIIFSTVRVVKTERLMGRNYCTNPLVVMTTVKSKKHTPTKIDLFYQKYSSYEFFLTFSSSKRTYIFLTSTTIKKFIYGQT